MSLPCPVLPCLRPCQPASPPCRPALPCPALPALLCRPCPAGPAVPSLPCPAPPLPACQSTLPYPAPLCMLCYARPGPHLPCLSASPALLCLHLILPCVPHHQVRNMAGEPPFVWFHSADDGPACMPRCLSTLPAASPEQVKKSSRLKFGIDNRLVRQAQPQPTGVTAYSRRTWENP